MIEILPVLAVLFPALQGVIYVDDSASGANDGSSWADAFTDLQDALAIAVPPDQVWVAEGVYRPTPGTARDVAFEPKTALYGGFAGVEATLAERAGLFDTTILTGDLLGDDGPGFVNYDDNSFRVVRPNVAVSIADTVEIDGFTIRGANHVGGYGGGVSVIGMDDVRLRNCRILENRAGVGGGLFGIFALMRIEDCLFVANESESPGGGVSLEIGSFARIARCWFLGNRAQNGGGGLYTLSDVVVQDSVFSGNATSGLHGGGAMFATRAPLLIGCTIAGNSAVGSSTGAGGLLIDASNACARVDVVNSILWGNVDDSGTGQGAQIRGYQTTDPPVVVSSCVQGWSGLGCSSDVVDLDPLFVDADGPDDVPGTLDDLLDLTPGSPYVDAGRPFRTFVEQFLVVDASPLDAARKRRFVDLVAPGDKRVLDLGALERPLDE